MKQLKSLLLISNLFLISCALQNTKLDKRITTICLLDSKFTPERLVCSNTKDNQAFFMPLEYGHNFIVISPDDFKYILTKD